MIPLYPARLSLTGHLRTRAGWFGRQVLQVELATQHYQLVPPRPDNPSEPASAVNVGAPKFAWRDATWSDVQELGILRGGAAPIFTEDDELMLASAAENMRSADRSDERAVDARWRLSDALQSLAKRMAEARKFNRNGRA